MSVICRSYNAYWDSFESIKAFSGEYLEKAKLYPEDYKYEIKPNLYVDHYRVYENTWL